MGPARPAPAQLSLDEWARAHPDAAPLRSVYADAPPRPRSLAARFAEFHAANPHVYAELVKLARRAKARGLRRLGIRTLWEVLRWQFEETARPGDDPNFKLNNNLHSSYARLIDAQEPDLRGLFELRDSPHR